MLLALFIASSFLLIWRLEHMTETGVEGTVLGTLVMPYCSGIGNLIFVFFVYTTGQPAAEVMTNCLVNNVTNLTVEGERHVRRVVHHGSRVTGVELDDGEIV